MTYRRETVSQVPIMNIIDSPDAKLDDERLERVHAFVSSCLYLPLGELTSKAHLFIDQEMFSEGAGKNARERDDKLHRAYWNALFRSYYSQRAARFSTY